jgi:hypothetical protein
VEKLFIYSIFLKEVLSLTLVFTEVMVSNQFKASKTFSWRLALGRWMISLLLGDRTDESRKVMSLGPGHIFSYTALLTPKKVKIGLF